MMRHSKDPTRLVCHVTYICALNYAINCSATEVCVMAGSPDQSTRSSQVIALETTKLMLLLLLLLHSGVSGQKELAAECVVEVTRLKAKYVSRSN